MLVDRIDVQRQSVGIVVGVVGAEGRRVVAYGYLEKGDARPLNGDTIFEIGSATKVFTSLLLADMVQRGELALDDPVVKYLPSSFFPVKMPERNGRSITLGDLATHTSGLPRLPTNMLPKNPANPYADYSVEQLYHCLASYQTDTRHRIAIRVLESRRRTVGACAGASGRNGLRDTGAVSDLRSAGHE